MRGLTLGTVTEVYFSTLNPFLGNLRDVYFGAGGGAGTYTTANPGENPIWVKV